MVAAASLRPARAGGPRSRVPRPHAHRALDIAKDADRALNDWESALRRTDAVLEVKRGLKRPAEDIARNRMNRAVALVRLGRFGEAKVELEECLQVFQNDPAMRAMVLGSLAICSTNKATCPRPSRRNAVPSRSASSCPSQRPRQIAQQPRPLPRTERQPVRTRRILSPSACRSCLSSRLRAGAGPPDLAAQLRLRFRRAAPPAPRWPCLAWTDSSPTPPSTR